MKTTGVSKRGSGFLKGGKGIQNVAGMAGALCLIIALAGCASSPVGEYPGRIGYNINTGYPTVEMPYPPHTP